MPRTNYLAAVTAVKDERESLKCDEDRDDDEGRVLRQPRVVERARRLPPRPETLFHFARCVTFLFVDFQWPHRRSHHINGHSV